MKILLKKRKYSIIELLLIKKETVVINTNIPKNLLIFKFKGFRIFEEEKYVGFRLKLILFL